MQAQNLTNTCTLTQKNPLELELTPKDARRVARDLVCKNKPGKKSLKKINMEKNLSKKNEHGKKSLSVFITFGGGTHHTDARRIALDLLRDENLQLLLVLL